MESKMEENIILFVLGAPGAGKGTQCELIVKHYGWEHLSAGDLLRKEAASGSEQGEAIQKMMAEGAIVPQSVTIGLLVAAMKASKNSKFLIDGFPRKLDQLMAFEQQVRPCDHCIVFDASQEVATQRLMERAVTSGRVDDNEETIRKRFLVFKEATVPTQEFLKGKGRVTEIPADGSVEEVWALVQPVLQQVQDKAAQRIKEHHAHAAAPAAASESASELAAAVGAEPSGVLAATAAVAVPVVAAAAVAAEVSQAEAGGAADGAEPEVEAPSREASPDIPIIDVSHVQPPVVICGPSGVGKGTIIARLMADHASCFGFSVSHTTRAPRAGEVDGVHYHFTTREVVERAVGKGQFLEHAEVHGNMYGTSLKAVADVCAHGKVAVLDIDVQGAVQVRSSVLGNSALLLFLAPPSMEELERRLRGRGTETEDKVLKRLANAKEELDRAEEPGLFNKVIINDNLDAAYEAVQCAIQEAFPTLLRHIVRAPPAAAAEPSAVASVAADPSAAAVGVVAEPSTAASLAAGASAAAVGVVAEPSTAASVAADPSAAAVGAAAEPSSAASVPAAQPSSAAAAAAEAEPSAAASAPGEAAAEEEVAGLAELLSHPELSSGPAAAATAEPSAMNAEPSPQAEPSSAASAAAAGFSEQEQEAAAALGVPSAVASEALVAERSGAAAAGEEPLLLQQEVTPAEVVGGEDSSSSAAVPLGAVASSLAPPAEEGSSHLAPAAGLAAGLAAVAAGGAAVLASHAGGPGQGVAEREASTLSAASEPAVSVPAPPPAAALLATPTVIANTTGLLDFGFGAAVGPAVVTKTLPSRQYLDNTVVPVLRDGLKALNVARPDDPLQFLADFLISQKAKVAA